MNAGLNKNGFIIEPKLCQKMCDADIKQNDHSMT